jgi:prepilin peptidase CpaA
MQPAMPILSSIAAAFMQLASTPRTATLLVMLVVAALLDWRANRVPNVLTYGGMLLGFAFSMPDAASVPDPNPLSSIGGMLLAAGCVLPLYWFRVLGAADVKLMAAVGAFVGHDEILFVLLFVLSTAGLVSLGVMLSQRALPLALSNLVLVARATALSLLSRQHRSEASISPAARLPYALCIFSGTFVFLAGARMGAW